MASPAWRLEKCSEGPATRCAWHPVRRRNLVAEARESQGYVICHDTLPYGAYPQAEPAVCRGFHDRYSTASLQIMQRLWGFVEVDPPQEQPPRRTTTIDPGAFTGAAANTRPLVLVDVDGVLNPDARLDSHHLIEAGYAIHEYDGPGPDDARVQGKVWLNPAHGQWLGGLAERGAELAWATAWGRHAAEWIAPRLSLPADMRVVDVGSRGGVKFGRSPKTSHIRRWAGARPFAWLDDEIGGRDYAWAEERTAGGINTLLVHVTPHIGLTRADVDEVHQWLDQVISPRRSDLMPAFVNIAVDGASAP